MKAFVENEADKLLGKTLYKEITVNGKRESISEVPDLEGWLRELDLFIQADINRPTLSDAYTSTRKDNTLNHKLKEGQKGFIKEISVLYKGDEVLEVSFITGTDNPFYSSKTRGVLRFDDESWVLVGFSLETNQKVIFARPNIILISGRISGS